MRTREPFVVVALAVGVLAGRRLSKMGTTDSPDVDEIDIEILAECVLGVRTTLP